MQSPLLRQAQIDSAPEGLQARARTHQLPRALLHGVQHAPHAVRLHQLLLVRPRLALKVPHHLRAPRGRAANDMNTLLPARPCAAGRLPWGGGPAARAWTPAGERGLRPKLRRMGRLPEGGAAACRGPGSEEQGEQGAKAGPARPPGALAAPYPRGTGASPQAEWTPWLLLLLRLLLAAGVARKGAAGWSARCCSTTPAGATGELRSRRACRGGRCAAAAAAQPAPNQAASRSPRPAQAARAGAPLLDDGLPTLTSG